VKFAQNLHELRAGNRLPVGELSSVNSKATENTEMCVV
jgi:hypothetical protein